MTEMTQEELRDLLVERFGEDPSKWAFICPRCGDIASVADIRAALAEHPRTRNGEAMIASDILGQECIGRTLGALKSATQEEWTGRGCDWTAFGLIPGPLTIRINATTTMAGFMPAPAPTDHPSQQSPEQD